MSRPKDGEERRVKGELVYQYVAGDSSVGIPSGWVLIGLNVGDRLFESEELVRHMEALPDSEFAEPERGEDC